MPAVLQNFEFRFWSKVTWTLDDWGIRFPGSRCWEWTGTVDRKGYGRIALPYPLRTQALAHRVAYELEIGEIPWDLVLDHLCRNPSCVNPWHLEPVTISENCDRGDRSRPGNRGRTRHEQLRTSADSVIAVIGNHPEGITPGELSRLLGIGRSAARMRLWRLEKDGFIAKSIHARNGKQNGQTTRYLPL